MRTTYTISQSIFLLLLMITISSVSFAQCNANAGPNVNMCAGEAETLGGSPSASGDAPYTYSWSPSTNLSCDDCPNPICTATTNTSYTLTITDDNGCTDSDNVNVFVSASPVAGFTFSPNNGCSSTPIQFTNTSTGSGLSYAWNFGDPGPGNNSSQTNPSHEFEADGAGTQSFNVRLIVTNSAGCKDTLIQTVTVAQSPGPALTDPLTSFKNCDGSTFDMTVYDISAFPGTSYTIDWGDGSPFYSSGTAPTGGVFHQYTTADIFELEYTITGTNGCTETETYLISNITNPAIGAANPGATTGCGPITLCFPLSNYAGNHSSTYYTVNYGDGSPLDTLPHPPPAVICHTYSVTSCGQPGNAFTFSMKAINSCDSSLASISPIRVYTGPVADFNPVPTVRCVNVPVTFQNTSTLGYNSSCSGSTIFNWNFGDGVTLTTLTLTNPTHAYAVPGTYTVTLSTQNACGTTTHSETVCIEAPPVPDFALDPDTACVPFLSTVDDLSIIANSCNITRNWNVLFNGSTCLPSAGTWNFANATNATSLEPEFQFVSPGQYTVRQTLTNSCGTFFHDEIVIGQAPPQITLPALPSICAGESVNPSSTIIDCYEPVDSYSWTFTGGLPISSNTAIPGSVQYVNAGTYSIQLQVTNQCGTVNSTIPVTVVAPPVADAGPDVAFCSGGNSPLGSAAVPAVTYAWTPTAGLSSSAISNPTVTLTNATVSPVVHQYILTASSSATCLDRDTVLVTVNPIPVLIINSPTICVGETAGLTVSGADLGGSYSWAASPSLSCLVCSNPDATPTSTTTYSVTGTNIYTCSSSTTATVTVNPLPIVNAGPDQTLCDQAIPVTFTASPIGGVWSGSANISSGGVFTPNGVETSNIYYTYLNPLTLCENIDTMIVTVNPPVIPVIDPLDSICSNLASVNLFTELNASPLGGVFSGPGVSANSFNPLTAGLGTHQIIYSVGIATCASADTAFIRVDPQPIITVNSETLCYGDTASLVADGAGLNGTYSWSPTTALSCVSCPNPEANPLSTSNYLVIGTTELGCSNTANSTVTVNPLPIVSAGPDLILCDQPVAETLIGTPSGGTWTGSVNLTAAGVFLPNGSETSSLIYTYTNPSTGCENSDTMIVTVSPAVIPVVDPTYTVCVNDPLINLSTTLNANPLGGTWSGSGVINPNFNPSNAGVGTFTLTYTYGSGTCQTFATTEITVNAQPVLDVNSETICWGDSVALVANGAGPTGTYSWTPTGTLSCTSCPDPIAFPAVTTNYTVVGTSSLGCSSSVNSTVVVNALPIVNAGPDVSLCDQPIPYNFTGSPIGGTWTGSANLTSGGVFTPNGTEISNLYYTFTDVATGCVNIDSLIVTVNPPIIPSIDPTYSLCVTAAPINLTTALNVTPTGGTWSGTGVSSPNFNPATSGVGTFTVSYTFGVGTCQTVVTSDITVNPQPIIAVNNETICAGQSAVLTASGAGVGGNYTWTPSTGLSCSNCPDPTANPTLTTVYSITGTTQFGCSNTATSTLTVNPLPIANAGPDTVICNLPEPVQFTGTQLGGVWTGTSISSTGLFTASGVGFYPITYTVTLGTGCVNSDTRIVEVVDPIPAYAGLDEEICIESANVNLTSTPSGGTWSGTNTTTTGIFSPVLAGTFSLVYTVGTGNCLTRDTMQFVVHPLPIVSAGVDTEFCATDATEDFVGNPSGGTWSGTGITDVNVGTFDPGVAGVGLHTIVYTFTDPITSCVNSDTLTADVHPIPSVDFTFNPVVCVGTSETITNLSTLNTANSWDFGDGATATSVSPNHTYTSTGFYEIELIVTSVYGCMDSLAQTIEVREPPMADFSVLPDSACGPMSVSFLNNSSGINVSYSWDFGNGQSSLVEDPSAQIYFAGILADTSYTIELEVSNFCGTVSHSESVIVMPTPTAIFGSDFNAFCSPFTANFASTSLGLPDYYIWDFGNGVTSGTSDSLFQQTFTTGSTPTDYTITLIVQNECGQDTAYHTITVLPNNVNAFFNSSSTTSCNDLTVNFTQYTLGGTIWSWNFGDGTTSSAYSPSHTYSSPGTYNVSLFANDGCSFDTTVVTIFVNEPPSVAFSLLPDSTCINSPFTFINESIGDVSSFWTFGDGTNSNLSDPTHAYTASGDYVVTLTGTSLINGCTSTVSQTVHVNTNPVAQFNAIPTNGCMPLTVQFNNTSNQASFYTWNFGDGNTSGLPNPSHTYLDEGAYTAQLIAENVNGCTDTATINITVYPIPEANFSTTYICGDPVSIAFTNQSLNAVSYAWNFGNGTTSTLNNPTVSFPIPGTYTVTLQATSQFGCTDQIQQSITIYPLPEISFILPFTEMCSGDVLEIVPVTSNVDSIVWNMGDGTLFTGDEVSYTYPTSGEYLVSAIAYGGGGCEAIAISSMELVVHPTAIADFSYENVESFGETDGTVAFTNESLNAFAYLWTFGDGDSSYSYSPTHIYSGSNDYTVTLIAYNEFYCNDTVSVSIDLDFFHGLFLPNAIYPGHSSFEVSHFIPKGVGMKEFELLIYDDWGNLIWQTTALDADGRPTESWDGTFNGVPVQQDAYVWKVTAIFIDESVWEGNEYKEGKFKKAGTVTVIR